MSSLVTVLDRLLEQAAVSENKEHVLEQASYAVDNVHQRLLGKYDTVIEEITSALGTPELNVSTDNPEIKNPMPSWVTGSKHGDAAQKVLRLSYWKREFGISYVILRTELDSRDRIKSYDIVLGARRRNKSETAKIAKMRNTDPTFMGWVKRMLSGNRG